MSTPAPRISRRVSRKASQFTESVIREMTREAMKYGAVNLSQGYPDFPAPADIKRVAMQAKIGRHTSELQSRLHLVCRLLLEKKKKKIKKQTTCITYIK